MQQAAKIALLSNAPHQWRGTAWAVHSCPHLHLTSAFMPSFLTCYGLSCLAYLRLKKWPIRKHRNKKLYEYYEKIEVFTITDLSEKKELFGDDFPVQTRIIVFYVTKNGFPCQHSSVIVFIFGGRRRLKGFWNSNAKSMASNTISS